jgi:hypothetical protein
MGLRATIANATATVFRALGDIPATVTMKKSVPLAYNPSTGKNETASGKLDGAITATALTITLKTLAGTWVPDHGVVKIGSEFILYTAMVGNQLTGCVRGYSGSTPASGADGAAVSLTSQDFVCLGILGSYKQFELIGTSILATDRKLSVRQAELPITPTTADRATSEGKTYTIQNIQADPAGVMWTLQVRG